MDDGRAIHSLNNKDGLNVNIERCPELNAQYNRVQGLPLVKSIVAQQLCRYIPIAAVQLVSPDHVEFFSLGQEQSQLATVH